MVIILEPAAVHIALPIRVILSRNTTAQTAIPAAGMVRGCAKTKSDLVVMPSGRQIFAFFCSPHDHRVMGGGAEGASSWSAHSSRVSGNADIPRQYWFRSKIWVLASARMGENTSMSQAEKRGELGCVSAPNTTTCTVGPFCRTWTSSAARPSGIE